MKSKFLPPKTSVLSDAGDEDLSEEEQARLVTEWVARTLDHLMFLTIGNKEVAMAICETAVMVGSLNSKHSEIIKEGLKKNNGRPNYRSIQTDKLLLIHYAYEVEEINHKSKALDNLIKHQFQMTRTMISIESMENNISKALKNMQKGEFSLSELPDWAQPIIQARINKGATTKKIRK